MFLAILLGVLAGLLGFLPLVGGLRLTKRTAHAGTAGSMMVLMVGLLVSFVLMFVLAIVYFNFDRPNGLAFVLAEVVALSVAAISYAMWQTLRK